MTGTVPEGHSVVGYLSEDGVLIERELRERFEDEFALVDRTNRLGMRVLHGMGRADVDLGDDYAFIAAALLAIVLRRCQGATLLAQRGLGPEADALTRCGLEALFFLGWLLKEPLVALTALDAAGVRDSRKLANAMINHRAGVAIFTTEKLAGVEDLLKELDELESRQLSTESVADQAGMGDLYLILYRVLSMGSVHLTGRNLMQHTTWAADERSVKFGPDDSIIGTKVMNVATVLVNTLRTVIPRFNLVDDFSMLEEVSQEFTRLGDRPANV